MNKPKIIILADIASLRITCAGFKDVIKSIETKYEVVNCKFYCYVAKRNRDFNEFISANAYDTELPSASRRRNKLDSKQVIDVAYIAELSKIDAVGLITGEGDILPMINLLKARGIDVFDINVAENPNYAYAYTGFFPVPQSALREGYAAPTTKKMVKKAPKPIAPKAEPAQQEAKSSDYYSKVQELLARAKKN